VEKNRTINKKVKIIGAVVLAGLFLAISFMLLVYNGVILLNNPSEQTYPVRGVDVARYQGEIDWEILAGENIDFAFIKATEGSSHVDETFYTNFESALKTNLKVGAYHFFSYDSEGKTQAENFIKTVSKVKGLLPPVVDIEFYGDKEENLPEVESTKEELTILLGELEQHYGKKPIIYATEKSYDLYIANDFEEYDIWIRGVYQKPILSDGRDWTYWQYTNRETLEGYEGVEKFIDMNVFYSSRDVWNDYIK